MFHIEDIESSFEFNNEEVVVYNEGEHIINIVKSAYNNRILKDPCNSLGYGFELSVPEGYKLVNSFALSDGNIIYIFVNEVPVIVKQSNLKNTINIGKPYVNSSIKLTKKY